MAEKKSKSDDIALEALKMDLEFRNRELAAQMAEAAAARALEEKRMFLIEQGVQANQAYQFAQQYALQIGQLEYEKTLGAAQLGLGAEQQRHTQQLDLMRQQFEEQFNTAAQMGFRDGVPTLDRYKHDSTLGEQQRQFDVDTTGYNNGRATLAREQFERGLGENQRQYNVGATGWMNGAATLEREQALESQRQFDVSTIMNAPRGAADYVSYIRKLRGLEGQGLAPGLLAQLATGEATRVAGVSNGGEVGDIPVASNLDLALEAVQRSRQNETISRTMDPRLAGMIGAGAQQNINVSFDPSQAANPPQFSPAAPPGSGQQPTQSGVSPNDPGFKAWLVMNNMAPGESASPANFSAALGGLLANYAQLSQADRSAYANWGANNPDRMAFTVPTQPSQSTRASNGQGGFSTQPTGQQPSGPKTQQGFNDGPSLMRQQFGPMDGSGQAASYGSGGSEETRYRAQNRTTDATIPSGWGSPEPRPLIPGGNLASEDPNQFSPSPLWPQSLEAWRNADYREYVGSPMFGLDQQGRNLTDWQNMTANAANNAYANAGNYQNSVMGIVNQGGPPVASAYQGYKYQSPENATQQTNNGRTYPGMHAPSNSSFQQYASQPSGGQGMWSSAAASSSSPYSERSQAVSQMYQPVYGEDTTPKAKTGDQWSLQAYRKLSPTEKQYAGGLVSADTGQSEEDFQAGMMNAAPNYQRSRKASWGGF